MNIQTVLSEKFSQAMMAAGVPAGSDPLIKQSTKVQFGDYQANGIMAIAKAMNIPPRQLAQQVLEKLELGDMVSQVEIAGPGFINVHLAPKWLAGHAEKILTDDRLGIAKVTPQTVVIDYSAPNVAKEMHVGHLRSTIIGDAMVRTLEFLGHKVIRANHIGDWGTQFGMLIAYLEKVENEHAHNLNLADLESFYRQAKKCYDEDEEFATLSRAYVVKLQQGDEYCLTMWRKLVDITLNQDLALYRRLNVTLSKKDVMGESLYNDMLPGIVADLKQKGLAVESEGAIVVYLDSFKNKNGEPMGVIIQKRDGGFLYATTDIACAKYRYEVLGADRIIYYTDSRQHQHLSQVWEIVRLAGYVPESVKLEHHMFGMILGKDGKPFKTRSGDTIKLADLLDEAIERAGAVIRQKSPELSGEELDKVIQSVGIGAVKYADLSKNRISDYVFDWDTMLSLEGNTAVYLQYAFARIISIFRSAQLDYQQIRGEFNVQHAREKALVMRLMQFEETVTTVAAEGLPHLLCSYLYEVAGLFSGFYQDCPILKAETAELKQSRLMLAALTARTLKQGLTMLGIETIDRM